MDLLIKIKEEGEGYILGLSLGASLAIHVALREPSLLKGIVLTGYSPFIPKGEKRFGMFHYIPHILSLGEVNITNAEVIRWNSALLFINCSF